MVRHPQDTAYFLAIRVKDVPQKSRLLAAAALGYASIGDADAASEIVSLLRGGPNNNAYILLTGDIALRLAESGQLSKAVDLVAHLTDPAEKNTAVEALVSYLIKNKDMNTALSLANQVTNTARKNRLLIELTEGYATNGFLTKAVEIGISISDSGKSAALYTVVSKLAEAQSFSKASDVAQSITDPALSQKAQIKIASEQAKARDFDAALQTAKQLAAPMARQKALQYVAIGYIQANQFLEAQAIADGIVYADIKEAIIAASAVQYAQLNEAESAEKALAQVTGPSRPATVFSVAQQLSKEGNFERAFELVNALSNPDKMIYMPKLAKEFGNSSQFLYTQLLIKQINPESLRQLATEQFLIAFATHAQSAKVLRLAADISDPIVRDRLMGYLVESYIARSDFNTAGDAAGMIRNPAQRLYRYCDIAIAAAVKDRKQSEEWIGKAEQLFPQLQTPAIQIDGLVRIADAYITLKNGQKAEDTLLKTADPLAKLSGSKEYLDTVTNICLAYERTGMSVQSLYLIRQIKSETDQLSILLKMPLNPILDAGLEKRRKSILRDIAR